jgi:hypothetical protein
MWNKFRKRKALCVEYREALEDLRAGVAEAEGAAELRSNLPEEVTAHAQSCEWCLETSEIFWESRDLLAVPEALKGTEPVGSADRTPWFATRVMAKIVERETEVRAASAEWTGAVTRLASRLVWVSALALVVAGTLVYDPQPRTGSNAVVSQAPAEAPQYLFDSATAPSNVDDALSGPAER